LAQAVLTNREVLACRFLLRLFSAAIRT